MAKKKPKTYKGTRYIAQKLKKYWKSRYPKYTDALPRAREIFSQLQSKNQKVVLRNIFPLERKPRTGTSGGRTAPEIPSKMLEESYYFELIDYPVYIARSTNKVYYTSELTPLGVGDMQGGSNVEYEIFFADFVNYINANKQLTDPSEKRYDTEWKITTLPPVWNPAKKRWESKIISIDSNGNEFLYNFDRTSPSSPPANVVLGPPDSTLTPPTSPTASPTASEPSSASADRVKEIRGLISDLREDAKAGLISKSDYATMVKELTAKISKGGKL